jgi:hypothetical protein
VRDQQAKDEAVGWSVCILYASGKEKVLWFCRNREVALRSIDMLYGYGYPLHFAYVLRKTTGPHEPITFYTHPIANQLKLKVLTPRQAPAWYS